MSAMYDHSKHVEWAFVVPPRNTTRVLITQRKDGPFRAYGTADEDGCYYVSVQSLVGCDWKHNPGSTYGLITGFKRACEVAEARWNELKGTAS